MEIIQIKSNALQEAMTKSEDDFLEFIINEISKKTHGELNELALEKLNADQITVWGYYIFRDEIMNGGFIQLIYNGYGPFYFDNPFAKAMRLWGLKELSKLIYKAKTYYDKDKETIYQERTDEEFMALFEQFPVYDELDDWFIEEEENFTSQITQFVKNNLDSFITIVD